MQNVGQRKEWTLTPSSFQRLLNWLAEGSEECGESYLNMRQRLVAYFDRKNCSTADELADETLNRVARRLDEENEIVSDSPAHYCYIVARFVFLEYLRLRQKSEVPLDPAMSRSVTGGLTPLAREQIEIREKLLTCLESCNEKLEAINRDLIIRYYSGEQRQKIENRRLLATEMGISPNALSIRACRIRNQLEACVRSCLNP